MSTRPGLIVLVLVLIGTLLFFLLRGEPATTNEASQPREEVNAKPVDLRAASEEAGTGVENQHDNQREAIDSGGQVYVLCGEVLRRDEVPLDGARVLAYPAGPHDRRLDMSSLLGAFGRGDSARAQSFGKLRVPKLGELLAHAAVQQDGRFEFTRLPTRHVRLTLDHRFYGLAQDQIVHIDPDRDGTVHLRPYLGGQIVGRIPAFEPGPGTNVWLIAEPDMMEMFRRPEDFMGMIVNSVRRQAPVAAGGGFEFRAVVPSASIHLTLRRATRGGVVGPIAVQAGQIREVVLRTEACGAVAAVIRDSRGDPVEGAAVELTSATVKGTNVTAFSTRGGNTDAFGNCQIDAVLPGQYFASVSLAGFVAASRDIVARGGDTTTLSVTLDRGGTVRGRVIDTDGEPVAEAQVLYVQAMNIPALGDVTKFLGDDMMTTAARVSRQRTDAEGHFELSGLAADEGFSVAAWHVDYRGGMARDVHMGDDDVVIRLQRLATIRGRVVDDESGEPLPTFAVSTVVRMALVIERPTSTRRVTDSKDGVFDMPGVPPGMSKLKVRAPGYADLRKSVEIATGEDTDVGVIRMHRGAVVRGVVRSPAGKPVVGAIVARKVGGMMDNPFLQQMTDSVAALTDRAGAFELSPLRAGRIRLKATSTSHASGVSERLRLSHGQVVEGVEIVLGEGGTIAGILSLPPGMSIDGWTAVVQSRLGGSMRSVRIAMDGSFRVEGIDPGKYEVQGMQADWLRDAQGEKMKMFRPGQKLDLGKLMRAMQSNVVSTRCRVKEGEVTEVVLDGTDLGEDGVALTIAVTLGNRPMQSGWLDVERVDNGLLTQAFIDAGIAKLPSVQSGRFRLTVRTGITMTPVGDPVTVEVPAAKTHRLPLHLPGGSVRGTVTDQATGDPLENAIVRIVSAKGAETDQVEEIGFAITGRDGSFQFEGLDDGRYSLFANDSFFARSGEKRGGRLDDVNIRGGDKVEGVVLRTRRAARVVVRVADESDLAQSRAMVLAVDARGKPMGSLPSYTNGKGETTLAGLPPGPVRIVALTKGLAPGYSEIQDVLTGRETQLQVVLPRGPRVRVRVENKAGKEIRGARLSARWKQGPWVPISLIQRYDAGSRRLDLGHLPPGRVEFRVHHRGARSFVVHRDLPAAASVELVFTAPE